MQKHGDRLPVTAALLSMVVTLSLFGLGSVLWLFWLFGGQGLHTWEGMGWWGPVVVLATGGCVMASLGALVLRGWKPRLPVAVFLALGLAPWLAGTLGTRWDVHMCFEAIANINPSDKATILAAGSSEALSSYLFGGGLSVALLLGLAAGLGTAALVVAARRRAPEGPSLEPAGPASAALLCLAAALAVGALLPSAFIHRDGFLAIANVNPLDRALLLAQVVSSLDLARQLSRGVLGAALALTMGAALWARGRSGTGWGRAVAAGLCVVPAFALHGLTFQDMEHIAQVTATKPWASAGDFQPVPLTSLLSSHDARPDALVTLTHLKHLGEEPRQDVPLEGALAPALRESLSDWQIRAAEVEDAVQGEEPVLRPTLSLAVDGRLDGAKLRVLVDAALTAGVRSLVLVGQEPSTPRSTLLEAQPLMAPFAREMLSTRPIALLSALPGGQPMEDGWDARLDANVLTLTPRPGSGEEPLTVDLSQPQPEAEPVYEDGRPVPVYLPVREALTVERLARVSEALSGRSTDRRLLLPVLLTAPLTEDAAPTADDSPR
jgi:hypothetical protein